jgi:hypothetical protein
MAANGLRHEGKDYVKDGSIAQSRNVVLVLCTLQRTIEMSSSVCEKQYQDVWKIVKTI